MQKLIKQVIAEKTFSQKKKKTIYEFSKIKKYEKKLIFSDKNVS